MAKEQPFEAFSGNDVMLNVTVIDADTNTPLDITGALALVWALAKKPGAATPIILKTLIDGVTVMNAAQGSVRININASELEPLKGVYYHELRLTNSQGKKITLLYGEVTITENLIRT